MSAQAGRLVLLNIGGDRVAACRAKSFKIANEPIDITTDDDNAWRQLLDGAVGSRTVEISVEGVWKAVSANLYRPEDILDAVLAGTPALVDAEVIVPGALNSYGGQFMITSFDFSAPHDDASTFSATLTSSGAFAPTPVST
jgi:TP901-1 family phage major tail protein